jgi:hypothetical protein
MVVIVHHFVEHGRNHLLNGTGKGSRTDVYLMGVAGDGHPGIVPEEKCPYALGVDCMVMTGLVSSFSKYSSLSRSKMRFR